MILYSKEELDSIRANLDANNYKFTLGEYRLIFTGGSLATNFLVQRVSNKYLGLAYNKENKTFIYNYPHIENKKDSDTFTDGFIEPKYNGTNYAIVQDSVGNLYHRTRGSINPEMFLNTINVSILQNRELIGVPSEKFAEFKKKYNQILQEGISKGYVDSFGNVLLNKINKDIDPYLTTFIGRMLNGYKVVGIFGEIISKYNPINVDDSFKYGIYIDMPQDFRFIVFDILGEKNGNVYFISPEMFEMIIPKNDIVEPIEYMKISELNTMLNTYKAEEGLVLKTEDKYLKLKREEVLQFERMIGKLGNVIVFSIEHVFSSLGFSKSELINNKSALNQEYLNGIRMQVWNEINNAGITKEALVEYFKSESKMYSYFNDRFDNAMLTEIASQLFSSGIPKEKLYLELPNYYLFNKKVIEFSEKRQKVIPIDKNYSKIVSRLIGKVYLENKE
ncbi:MAG: RNA ligase family protein [Candidatus Micrarchaeaceae archaeon]